MSKADKFEQIIRPSWLEIDLDAIAQNVQTIKKYLGKKQFLAIVKADAYGLGAIPVSKIIVENGADKLGVVMLDEGIQLRNAGITHPIFNLGPIFKHQVNYVVDHNFEQMVYRTEIISALNEYAKKSNKKVNVHIKIDTGMSRYGVPFSDAVNFFSQNMNHSNVNIIGTFSHFPMSDAVDKSFANLQIERINKIKAELEAKNIHIPTWHMSNSGGTLDLPEAHFDMVRVGLMCYGYFPSKDVKRHFKLKPALSLKSRIAAVRELKPGDTVGYGRRYTAEKNERIAVLPIGYADGYDRKLRNIGQVLIEGKFVQIVGGLCMDACFVNITDFPDIHEGQLVTLMGEDDDQEISPHDIAGLIDSVSYEVISRFTKRLPRVYLKNNQIVEINNSLLHS